LESEDTTFDSKFTTQYFSNHNITLGGQWWEANIKDGLRANKEISFKQLGLFAEDTWSITDSLALTLGLRYDDHDTFGDFWTLVLIWSGMRMTTGRSKVDITKDTKHRGLNA
jgi:outer membrane receptor for ferrienterochelin and colicins